MDPVSFLLSLERLGMKFGLENITRLCAALGHPERGFASVVVAGTNGKGSVTAMVHAALAAAGHRAARYTSPHLVRLEERFVVGDHEVSRPDLETAAGRVQEAVERLLRDGGLEGSPTFFECTTATAFELFRSAGIELAVLEVGLGGRLDATNVVTPLVAAITSIGLDHQEQLGDSIESIAAEKAGVIKPGVPAVCGRVPDAALRVIAATCQARGSPLVRVEARVQVRARIVDGATIASFRTPGHALDDVRLALAGRHQADNAATALCVLEELSSRGVSTGSEAVLRGLTEVKWPARLERMHAGGAEVLLDAAHNPAGARALAAYLRETDWTNVTLLFGAMRDKDIAGMFAELLPLTSRLICTTPASARALPADEVARVARDLTGTIPRIEAIGDPEAAARRACEPGARVVVTGSIFLTGPLRGILR